MGSAGRLVTCAQHRERAEVCDDHRNGNQRGDRRSSPAEQSYAERTRYDIKDIAQQPYADPSPNFLVGSGTDRRDRAHSHNEIAYANCARHEDQRA